MPLRNVAIAGAESAAEDVIDCRPIVAVRSGRHDTGLELDLNVFWQIYARSRSKDTLAVDGMDGTHGQDLRESRYAAT